MTPFRTYAIVAAGLLLAAPAIAQTTLPPGPSAPEQRREPAHPRADRPPAGRPNESPSESLGQAPTSGVLKPPETGDSGVIAPRNRANTPMPEIRPPGTPGNQPDVQPK